MRCGSRGCQRRKVVCESAKLNLNNELADSHTANSFCESAKQSCHSDLVAANTAKTSCESTRCGGREKDRGLSDLATCQFDLTEAQAVQVSPVSPTTVLRWIHPPMVPLCSLTRVSIALRHLPVTQTINWKAPLWAASQGADRRSCAVWMEPSTTQLFAGVFRAREANQRLCHKTKGNLEGSVLSYTCDTGYLIQGTENGSTCQADGTWVLEHRL